MGLKDLLFKDEPGPKLKPLAPKTAIPVSAPKPTVSIGKVETPAPTGSVYNTLREKTDFETMTTAGQTLSKFIEPLRGLGLAPSMLYKAAFAQAQTQSNISAASILDAFEAMKAVLKQEAASFQATIETAQLEINKKLQLRAEAQQQINDLQKQISTLTGEIESITAKIERVKNDFNLALNTRTTEIDQQKASIQAMLGA